MGHRQHSDGLSQPTKPALRAAAPLAARTRAYYETMSASSVGIELSVAVLLGLFFGRWLDGRLGTAPWMMIGFLVVGFAAGMRAVMRYAAKDAKLNDLPDGEADPAAGESKLVGT